MAVVVIYLIVGVVCSYQLGGDLVAIPISEGRSVDVGLGTSCVCGLMAAVLFSSPDPQRERAFPDVPIRVMRVSWAGIVLVWPALWVVLFQHGSPESLWWMLWFVRNHVLVTGLAMVCSVVVSVAWAWLPGSIFVLLCWIIGTKDAEATPYWWALLDHSPFDPLSLAVAAGLVAVGLVLQWHTPGSPR